MSNTVSLSLPHKVASFEPNRRLSLLLMRSPISILTRRSRGELTRWKNTEKHRKRSSEGDLSVSVRLAVGPESRFSSQLANVKDSVKKMKKKPKRKEKTKSPEDDKCQSEVF